MSSRDLTQHESLGELLGELASHSANLVRDEVALAKQELTEKLRTVQATILIVLLGAVTGMIAAASLCAAIILALAKYLEPWLSALLVGVVLSVAAATIIVSGLERLRRTALKPEQTLATLEENKQWLKEMT